MKNKKRLLFSSMALTALLFLSGCVQQKNGVPTGEGWVYKFLVAPMGSVIRHFAIDQGLGFGLAIILVTIIVRFIILPLGIYQSWKAGYQTEKRNSPYLKPVFDPINERIKNAETQEEKLDAQQELMSAQKEYGISMFGGMGCLPILIQWPFFSALFYAARFTEGISEASFMGIDLGSPSIVLTIVAGVLYFIQSLLMTVGVDEAQKQQMKSMMLMNPLLIVMFSWRSAAGLTLYWVVGGLFGILQQLLTTFIIKPILRKKVEEEFAANPPKIRPRAKRPIKTATPANPTASIAPTKSNRNAGKQRSRK